METRQWQDKPNLYPLSAKPKEADYVLYDGDGLVPCYPLSKRGSEGTYDQELHVKNYRALVHRTGLNAPPDPS